MKNLLALVVLWSVVCGPAFAQTQTQLELSTINDSLDYGATNRFAVDVSRSSVLSVQVAFTGAGAHTTTAAIGVTNSAAATNGETLNIVIAGVSNIYTWKPSPVTLATNYSLPFTNVLITLTNAAEASNTLTLTVALNSRTNVFTWTNAVYNATDLLTNTTSALIGTALYNALQAKYPAYLISQPTATTIAFPANFNDRLTISAGDFWGSVASSVVYSVTNIVATNSMQIASTNTAAAAATNLYTRLAADLSTSLTVSYASATAIQLVTRLDPGLTVFASGIWSTNLLTTNAIAGGVIFSGSNSLDRVTWFRDSTKDFTVPYSTTTAVSFLTNWTGIGAVGWYGWAVQNAAANYAAPDRLLINIATKRGL